MARDTGHPFYIENALRRDAFPRVHCGVFDAEFTCKRNYASRLLCCFCDNLDHAYIGRANLPTLSSASVGDFYVGRNYNVDMSTIGDRIRSAREMKGLTQQELADHFGISRVSVTQWELGTTQPGRDKYEGLANLLGGNAEWFLTGKGVIPISDSLRKIIERDHPTPNAKVGDKIHITGKMLPVYGQAVGGLDGEFLMNGNVLYEVICPPQLSGVSNAYAVGISGDSMAPRYEDGEVAYIDPNRRVKKGDYVVAQIQFEEHGPPLAFIKKFVRHNGSQLVLSQFNPEKELTFPHENVVSVHYIVMAGTL